MTWAQRLRRLLEKLMPPSNNKHFPPVASLTLVSADVATRIVIVSTLNSTPGASGPNRPHSTPDTFASWELFWGDGTSTRGTGTPPAQVSHTYGGTATSFTIQLVVVSSNTLQAQASLSIVIAAPPPVPDIPPPPDTPPDPPAVFCSGIINNLASPTKVQTLTWLVSFSVDVTGVALSAFDLVAVGPVGASLTSVTPITAGTYTVTADRGTGNGSLTLNFTTPAGIVSVVGSVACQGTFSGTTYTIVEDPIPTPVPEPPPPPPPGGRQLLGGWRLAEPFARGAIAIDFSTMTGYMVGHAQQNYVQVYNLPAIGSGTDVNQWPIVVPTRTIPGWWPTGYCNGLVWWNGKLWASPRVFYDGYPSAGEPLTIYGIDPTNPAIVTPLALPYARQAFSGFIKRGPGQDPLIGGGGYESGQGTVSGPTLATLAGQVLTTYEWLNSPGPNLEFWNTRAPREPNYEPTIVDSIVDPTPEPGDSWMGWTPRTVNGVLQGRWASDRVYAGGLALAEGITYWAWMGTGVLDYRIQTYTFAPDGANRTYEYHYSPQGQFLNYVARPDLSWQPIVGQELGPDGRVYLAQGSQWQSASYPVDVAIKVYG